MPCQCFLDSTRGNLKESKSGLVSRKTLGQYIYESAPEQLGSPAMIFGLEMNHEPIW